MISYSVVGGDAQVLALHLAPVFYGVFSSSFAFLEFHGGGLACFLLVSPLADNYVGMSSALLFHLPPSVTFLFPTPLILYLWAYTFLFSLLSFHWSGIPNCT